LPEGESFVKCGSKKEGEGEGEGEEEGEGQGILNNSKLRQQINKIVRCCFFAIAIAAVTVQHGVVVGQGNRGRKDRLHKTRAKDDKIVAWEKSFRREGRGVRRGGSEITQIHGKWIFIFSFDFSTIFQFSFGALHL